MMATAPRGTPIPFVEYRHPSGLLLVDTATHRVLGRVVRKNEEAERQRGKWGRMWAAREYVDSPRNLIWHVRKEKSETFFRQGDYDGSALKILLENNLIGDPEETPPESKFSRRSLVYALDSLRMRIPRSA